MAYEFPTDLIQQVKRATRAEAGLSHYDPTQFPLQPMLSISEIVASFDPSPPYLRCKNCKGRLLRGVQSHLCIYCGRRNDVAPDPISFKDTFAFRWLLESLHLDGSETVGSLSEKGELNRAQRTSKVDISLSDLLDFKISGKTEEKGGINASNKKQVERNINLAGIDLDNFFHESRWTDPSVTPEEHPSTTRNDVVDTEIEGPATYDNLSFFENIEPSESAVQSSKYEDTDTFSGWEAEFQSAYSGEVGGSKSFDPSVDCAASPANHHESSKPPDSFGGSAADNSSQLDSVFGPVKDSKNGRLKDDSTASVSTGDWTSEGLWNNTNWEAPLQHEQPVSTVSVNDAHPQDSMSNIDFSLHLDSVFGPAKDTKDGNQQDDLANSPSVSGWTSDDLWNNLNKQSSSKTEQHDATLSVKDTLPQDNMSNLSTGLDWFQVDQWQNNTNVHANNVTSGDQVPFDDWNDFTGSTRVQDSSETAPTQNHNKSITISESTSTLNLFSPNNDLDEMDFGSFSQADPFPSSSSKGSVSKEMNDTGLDRMVAKNDVEGMGQPASSGEVHSTSTQSREDVKMLLSQMHDLSFMLENKLSVPTKSYGSNSFQ